MIYAACAIGGLGMAVTAVAPSIPVFVVGVVALGVASGTFLAVDWALMTDIIPKACIRPVHGHQQHRGGRWRAVCVGDRRRPIIFVFGGDDAVRRWPAGRVRWPAIGLFVLAAFFLRRVDARPREERLAAERAR